MEAARLLLLASAETASCQPATRSKEAIAPLVARWMVPQQQSQSHQDNINKSKSDDDVTAAANNNKLFHDDDDLLLPDASSLEARLSAALMQGKTVEQALQIQTATAAGGDDDTVSVESSLSSSQSQQKQQ